MSYYLAPCLVAFRDEINEKYPERDKSSDGWIGDPSHAARPSDHNPDYAEGGIVRAIDVDSNGPTGVVTPVVADILKAAIGDSRVYYVIWNRKIYSRTYGFEARAYAGSNPHDHHVHISCRDDDASEKDTSKWLAPKVRVKPRPIDLPALREQMKDAAAGRKVEVNVSVRRLQKALNAKYGPHLKSDGLAGEQTLNSYGRHERAAGVKGAPRIPDAQSLPSLIKGLYYIKDEPVRALQPPKPHGPRKDSK